MAKVRTVLWDFCDGCDMARIKVQKEDGSFTVTCDRLSICEQLVSRIERYMNEGRTDSH